MTQISPLLLADIAEKMATPCFVYSGRRIAENVRRLLRAFDPSHTSLCYSVKANGNLSILRLLRDMGCGFDVVSAGEMQRARLAGADPATIVFAGAGKRDDELSDALDARIGWINVESAQELRVLSDIAQGKGVVQQVALRLNPNIDPHTHRHMATGVGTSKFGIGIEDAMRLVANRGQFPGVAIRGMHIHIGSMVSEPAPYTDAMQVGLDVIAECRGMGAEITTLDLGGGFGVAYTPDQSDAPIEQIAEAIVPMAKAASVKLQLEPGRSIIADAGVLLTRVLYTKTNGGVNYAVVDAAMNDLIRPALYGAKHAVTKILDLRLPIGDQGTGPFETSRDPRSVARNEEWERERERGENSKSKIETRYSIVGPICESGDTLAENVMLPELKHGDLLQIHHAGAYGMSMSSNYNTRARAAEVLVEDAPSLQLPQGRSASPEGSAHWRVIKPRERLEALWAGEVEFLQ
jgi:diaminopimelate decarboxylase